MKRKNFSGSHRIITMTYCLMLSSCISYKAVQIKEIKSIQLLNNDISSGKINVSLRVMNPNNYSIKVKNYDLHAFINNSDLGRIEVANKIVIPKKSDQDYQITFAPDLSKIMGELPSLLLMGGGQASIKGSVRLKAFFLSKKFSVDLKKKVSAADFR